MPEQMCPHCGKHVIVNAAGICTNCREPVGGPKQTVDPNQPSDFERLTEGYRSFRLLGAKLTAVTAAIYGAIAWKPYFLVLGIAAVVLFFVWERMIAADETSCDD